MTEERKLDETAYLAAKQKSLEQLFDYTKFHIQVYISLTTLYAGAINSKLIQVQKCCALFGILAVMVAGLAGGVIASSITQTVGGSSVDFLDKSRIGPFQWKCFSARKWTYVEHVSFWIGLFLIAISLIPQAVDSVAEKLFPWQFP